MKTLALLLLSAALGHAAETNLTWRLQIELTTTNSAMATVLSGQVVAAVPALDRSDPEGKGSDVEVRQNERGEFQIGGVYILKDETAATNILAAIDSRRIAAIRGRLVLHLCPLEGTIKDWAGCDRDPRAQFRERTW